MSSFFSELKRRNVFKVGVAYAIVAWLLIEIVATVFPLLTLPDWSARLITVVILIGFPIAIFLAWAYELTPEGIKASASVEPGESHRHTVGERLNYIILGLVVLAVVFILVDNYVLEDVQSSKKPPAENAINTGTTESSVSAVTPPPAAVRVRRFQLNLGMTGIITGPNINAFIALSPDDEQLAYAVVERGGMHLYLRSLVQSSVKELQTPGAYIYDIFFSPDGEWVGFSTNNRLYKVSVQGGSPRLLCDLATYTWGGHWAEDGYIYFGNNQKLHRVPATGGAPEPVSVKSEVAGWNQRWPYVLPDGTHLLLSVSPGTAREGQIVLLNLETGDTRTLIQNGFNARYVPTGDIVFMRAESIWAVPFDLIRLVTTGPEVPVVNGVQMASDYGQSVYSFSDSGLLAYLPGVDTQGSTSTRTQLVWIDRHGNETPLKLQPNNYSEPHLSPDETQVAVEIGNNSGRDIWTYDLNQDILSRRTFNGNALIPTWTPDGTHLAYTFFPDFQGIAWVKADGTGQPELLLSAPRLLYLYSFTPDGSQLLYNEGLTGPNNIYALSMLEERTERELLTTQYFVSSPALSPDGHWLAYISNETGPSVIYVRPFPDVEDGRWQISREGGYEPRWRGDSKEIYYYVQSDNRLIMFAVPVETEQRVQAGVPVKLFSGDYFMSAFGWSYDVTADGQRFLMVKAVEETGEDEQTASRETNLTVIDNWFEELKRLAPPGK